MTAAPDVLVVGAGFAGVAAATALAERGARVLVLEARQRPGGRAYSWLDSRTGEVRDNGQHVLAAFYTETLRLLDRLGTRDALDIDPTFRIRLWERGRGDYELACPDLPHPFQWLAAAGSCARLSATARVSALTLHARARALIARNGDGVAPTVERWLAGVPGGEDLAVLLRPVAIAALNEVPEEGSALLLARVLDRLFASPAKQSGLALPRRGMGDLFSGFEEFVASRGGEVRYRETALGVRIDGTRATGVTLLGGTRVDAGVVILAVPHERAGWIVRPEVLGPAHEATTLPWSPIVSTVHAYDRPFLPARFVGMIGTATQWAFDRGQSAPGRHLVGTVRSAAFRDATRSVDEIARETDAELREAFASAGAARLLDANVYKERRATMRSTPEAQRLRPGPKTRVQGLLLAGDWTDTGFPPTIESAVLSGHRAAELAA
ncbi:MAG: hydroxysqualene dehydroxylase HpnE [Candidatus Eiseniibacteriota bacterium]